ncbi:MAG TPA: NADH-quinone oxidoreductase subunit J [Anaerolineales bacterium]|nr:NADH-quinone oxidoreductase subunit J [Anaerolineales bacterium]
MTPMQIIFIVVAVATLGAAFLVVTTRNLVHAALWLVVALFGIAIYYVMLSAGFLAMAQVVIYIGAIAILMIFAIMLTRRVVGDARDALNSNWPWAALTAAALFGVLIWTLSNWTGINAPASDLAGVDTLRLLGAALVSPNAYILPFEIASILLLAALIGAIFVAWDRDRSK